MLILGKILGWLIVSAFALTLFNYPVKLANRKLVTRLPRESQLRRNYQAFMRLIMRGHRYFAVLAILSFLAHLLVQKPQYGIRWTGIAAGSAMIAQGILGAYGTWIRKRKPTAWFYIHRTLAVLIIILIIIHISFNLGGIYL